MKKDNQKKLYSSSIMISFFIVGILALFINIASDYFESMNKWSLNSRVIPENIVVNAEEVVEPEPVKELTEIELVASNLEESINFLVCGIDYSEGELRGHLTDVIMLINYNRIDKKINVLQIPRDCYIGDNYTTSKINAVYGMKKKDNDGIAELISVVQKTFSIYIDHYITLNMDEFIIIIDKIGGVEVDVPVNINLEGYTIRQGLQVLDGKYSQIFVRERMSYAMGDLGRIEMQEVFLKALIQKLFTISKSEAVTLIPSILSELSTDLSLNEVLAMYEEILALDYTQAITFHDLDVVGLMHNGLSVLSIQSEPTAELLNEYFRPYQDDVSADELGIIEIPKSTSSYSSSQSNSVQTTVPDYTNYDYSSNNSYNNNYNNNYGSNSNEEIPDYTNYDYFNSLQGSTDIGVYY